MASIGVGLIGSGFMGKTHALALRAARPVFGDAPAPRLEILCDTPLDRAEAAAEQFGFARAAADWRAVIQDPAVDLVSITTPNKLHCEIALAAAAAGKHIWCEKPLALPLADAERMTAAVTAAAVRSMVGYNYLHNPAFQHARRLIEAGEIGDLGCHLVSLACAPAGPIESVAADMQTVRAERDRPDGGKGAVENDDLFSALARFESGVQGVLCRSRVAWRRKNRLEIEAHGDAGQIVFDQERMNELRLYRAGAFDWVCRPKDHRSRRFAPGDWRRRADGPGLRGRACVREGDPRHRAVRRNRRPGSAFKSWPSPPRALAAESEIFP